MGGKVVGIISLKGGVGKTSSVSNLGACLARDFHKKVLIVDANFSAPNLALHIGLIDPKITIHDVLLNKAKVEDSIYKDDSGFHIIPGSFLSRKVNPFRLKEKLNPLRECYDIILIDSSPNLNDEMIATMIASDELLVMTSPDYPTLSTTLRAIRLATQKNVPIKGLVVNRSRGKNFELNVKDIESAAQVPVLCVLPEDLSIPESIFHTTPASIYKPNSKASIEYKKLAGLLIGEKYEEEGIWSRLMRALRLKR